MLESVIVSVSVEPDFATPRVVPEFGYLTVGLTYKLPPVLEIVYRSNLVARRVFATLIFSEKMRPELLILDVVIVPTT